jgi:elongation factor Ts
MEISAALVKELRERTGSGMMECKKALVETKGDIDAAVELMRKAGLAKADKRAGRTAAEGLIVIERSPDARRASMAEVNCETDFVSKGDDFRSFAQAVAQRVLRGAPESLDALLNAPLHEGQSKTVNETRQELVGVIGENMNVRRYAYYSTDEQGRIGAYLHGSRIGVLVEMKNGSEELAKDVAMHVAASKPVCVQAEDVPAELVTSEREIFSAQAAASGKPANIVEKMVEGRIKKFLSEVALVGQPFVKDPNKTVGQLLEESGATVIRFQRFEVGEGIEKKSSDFAAEVMEQIKG